MNDLQLRRCPHCERTGGHKMWPKSMLENRRLYGWCRECRKNIDAGYRIRNSDKIKTFSKEYKRTVSGLINTIFWGQKLSRKSSKSNKIVLYTLEELTEWVIKNPKFGELYLNWQNSGYDKWLKPSIDRILPSGNYDFKNIRLVTWKENDEKGKRERFKNVG